MIVDNGKYYLYRHIRVDKNEPFYIGVGTKKKSFASYEYEYGRAFSVEARNAIWRQIVSKTKYDVEILLESDDKEFISKKEVELINLYGRLAFDGGILSNFCKGGYDDMSFLTTPEITKDRLIRASTPAYLYDNKNGKFIRKFDKLTELCEYTNLKMNHISSICKKRASYKDYIFSDMFLGEKVNVNNYKIRVENGVEKIIYKIDKISGEILEEYKGLKKAAKSIGVSFKAISQAVLRKGDSGGFFWSYVKVNDLTKFNQLANNEVCKLCSLSFEVLKIYSTITDAAKSEGVKTPSISRAIRSKGTSRGNYFCYLKDLDNIDKSDFNKPLSRKISRVSVYDGSVKFYNVMRDAARELNINSGRICEAIKYNKIVGGYKWNYQ